MMTLAIAVYVRKCGRELHIAAAHHARVEGDGEQDEHADGHRHLDSDVRPQRQMSRPPIDRRKQRDAEVQSVGNREGAHVDDGRDDQDRA